MAHCAKQTPSSHEQGKTFKPQFPHISLNECIPSSVQPLLSYFPPGQGSLAVTTIRSLRAQAGAITLLPERIEE